MDEKDVEARLRGLQEKTKDILKLLALDRFTPEVSERIEWLARALKDELRSEDQRVALWRTGDGHTFAETGIYKPSIVEAWVAISSLRVDGAAKRIWYDNFDDVRYSLGKHLQTTPSKPE